MNNDAIVVTGIGVITGLGRGCETNFHRLCAGQSGVKTIDRFETKGLPTRFAACFDDLPREMPPVERTWQMARAVADEALAAAKPAESWNKSAQLFSAVSPIEVDWGIRLSVRRAAEEAGWPVGVDSDAEAGRRAFSKHMSLFYPGNYVLDKLCKQYELSRHPIATNTACASGATAIQLAKEALDLGLIDTALVIGTDSTIWPEGLVRFSLLSALSTRNEDPQRASRPFCSDRDGFVMGEGAGALVLERARSARARGAAILACIHGCGDASDNFHRTRSNPDGSTIVLSMKKAIDDAGLCPADVDYINAHGTSTPENDKMEATGINLLFGDHARRLLVSSNKSMIGHTLTACGTIESIFTVMALQRRVVPPTINYDRPDPEIDLDVVPNVSRASAINYALSNSFGFGGQNVSLVFGSAETAE